jgi:protein-disulfide isomerase
MRPWFPLVLLVTLAVAQSPRRSAQVAPAPSPARKSALNKPTLEAYVRHLFIWGPNVAVEIGDPKPSRRLPGFLEVPVRASAGAAGQEELFYVSRDGARILKALVFDVNQHPFQEEMNKLNTQLDPAFGAPEAPVTLVLFSDFQCGYCKEEALVLRKNIPATFPNEVRVFYKDFPLDSIHPWARMAAIAGRCIFRQRPVSFWDFHDWLYEHQAEITPENLRGKVMEFVRARSGQLDALQFQRCLETRATESDVDRSIAEGKALQVNSTPTLFVNGRKLVGQLPWSQLRQVIEYEIGYWKSAQAAGENCCEVRIPSPMRD